MRNREKVEARKPVLILGVGNLLMGDDGVGVYVAQALERMKLPPNVRVVDAGTGGVTLIGLMEDADCVILIDAADMGRPPGTCAVFSPGEVQSLKKDHRFSLHHADLLGLLELMRKVYHTVPAVRVVAVQPERVQWRDRLSDTIKAKIPEIVSLVRAEIHSVGERLGAGKKSRCIDGIC